MNLKVLINAVMTADPVDKILAQWQKERPDLDVSPMGIIGRVAWLHKYLQKGIGETFVEFDLNPGEFDVLATLRRAGKQGPENLYQLTPTELFKSMMVSSGTMTHRVDKLEKVGLVKRVPDPGDRRGLLICLTDKGFDTIEAAVTAHVANEHRILSGLSKPELDNMAKLMRKLLLSLEE